MEWLTNLFYSLAPYFQFPEVIRYAVEIVVVAFVVYQLMILVRKTRAEQVLKGVILLLFVYGLSLLLDLKTIVWVISNAIQFGVIALLIVFQPELRKALEQIGRSSRLWGRVALWREGDRPQQLVTALTRAMLALAREKTGALIVLEETTGMNDIISTGVALDGLVTAELLVNIFEPNTPPPRRGGHHPGGQGSGPRGVTCLSPKTRISASSWGPATGRPWESASSPTHWHLWSRRKPGSSPWRVTGNSPGTWGRRVSPRY